MKRSILKQAATMACLAVSIFILPQAAIANSTTVESASIDVESVIGSNGSDYVIEGYGELRSNVRVQLSDYGRIKSFETWLELRYEDFLLPHWKEYKSDGYKKTYKKRSDHPTSVNKLVHPTVNALAMSVYSLHACNGMADKLRQNGLGNTAIFSIDRTVQIKVRAGMDHVRRGNNVIHEYTEYIPKEVSVTCGKWGGVSTAVTASHFDVADPVVLGSWLFLDQKVMLNGVCQVKLNGSLQTSQANMTVKFRYHDDKGHVSDLKTVTSNANKTAHFTHTYDVPNNPNGMETGSIKIVGVSNPFESLPYNYEMSCVAGTPNLDVIAPREAKVTLLEAKDYVTLADQRSCPTKVVFMGTISGNGHAFNGHAAIQVKENGTNHYSQTFDANIPGQIAILPFGTYTQTLDWTQTGNNVGGTFATSGTTGPTSQTVYAKVKVYNADMEPIQPVTAFKSFVVSCQQGPQQLVIPPTIMPNGQVVQPMKNTGASQKKIMKGTVKKQMKMTVPAPQGGNATEAANLGQPDLIATNLGMILGGGVRAWGSTVVLNNASSATATGVGPNKNLCRFTQTAFRPFNKGTRASGAFAAAVYRNGTKVHTANFNLAANAGSAGDGWHKFNLNLAQGMNTVKVVLDSGNAVNESNEGNNVYTVKVNVGFACAAESPVGKIQSKQSSQPVKNMKVIPKQGVRKPVRRR